MPTTPLPPSTPSDEGVDAAGVLAFVDALDADERIEPHSLMLLRHGRVVAQGWWSPFGPDRVHLLYSLSKTFTASALGFAVAEGLVGLDDLVIDHFPEFADEITGPRSRRIRVRHLAAMASGHRQEMADIAVATDPAEPVRGFLLHEPEEEPGTWFTYNQPCTYTIAAIIQRHAGTSLVDYLRPRLLDPLGIGPVGWQEYPPGRNLGYSGLHAATDAIARLGQLYLQDGGWEGRQLLPDGWTATVRQKHVENPNEPEIDWRQGYGFQVWHARHGYRGDGAFGQFCVILPEQDAVLAMTASTEAMQAVLELAWAHLLPALRAGGSADADARLAERLAGLALAPAEGGPQPRGDAEAWAGRYAPSGPADARPAPTAAELLRDGDGWSVRLEDAGGTFTVPVPGSTWRTVEGTDGAPPVAVSGGWAGDGALALDLLLLETPHRLRITLQLEGRRIHAAWRVAPLGSTASLRDLRAPRPLS